VEEFVQYLGLARIAPLFTEGFAAAGGTEEKLRCPIYYRAKAQRNFIHACAA
jgi:hypothetical protein